jgi:peptide deformylase
MIAKKPARLSDIDAASVPVVSVTAWQALFEQAHLTAGETLLALMSSRSRLSAGRSIVPPERPPSSYMSASAAQPAIGITATHIGVLKRLAVIELAAANGVRTYVNPQIVWASADMIRHEEGSVSMPGVTEEIERCPSSECLK